MKGSESSSSKLERKTVEKNRRMYMKSLCFKLASLIPFHYSQGRFSTGSIGTSRSIYIESLREKLEVLKEKRAALAALINSGGMMMGLRLPVIEVRDSGSTVEVVLITGSNENFTLRDVVSIIEEGGAQVVNATFSSAANMVFHLIHSQLTVDRDRAVVTFYKFIKKHAAFLLSFRDRTLL